MQISVDVTVLVAHVIGEQVSGHKESAVLQHRKVGFTSEQVQLLWLRPSAATILRPKQNVLFQHLAAFLLVLVECDQNKVPVGQHDEIGFVIVVITKRNTFAIDGIGGQGLTVFNAE